MAGNNTTQNIQPLNKASSVRRDALGAVCIDTRAAGMPRKYIYCQYVGLSAASMGTPVGPQSIGVTAGGQSAYHVTADISDTGAGSLAGNFLGIAVCDSNVTSGHFFWVMNQGVLGKVPGSKHPATIYALVDTGTTTDDNLVWSANLVLSGAPLVGSTNKACGRAWSTDVGGKLTTGYIKPPILQIA